MAEDNCGNTTTHIQTVSVEDTTAPTFNEALPADVTEECDAVTAAVTLTASDNCDTDVTVTYSEVRTDGSCEDTYTLTRTWVAEDNCGNTTTHIQTVSVEDTTAPTFNEALPADVTEECDAVTPAVTLTASDNCDTDVTVTYSEVRTDGSCEDTYTLTRTWVAGDNCGNTTTHIQTVSVEDTTAPTFNEALPADVTEECDAVTAAVTLTASDNCDTDVTVTYSEVRTDGAREST